MITTAKLCFVDTETTSLRADRRAWEIGIITRNLDFAPDASFRWFVAAEDLDLGNADPMALQIGGFYDRHPQYAVPQSTDVPGREFDVMQQVELVTRGAHLIGAIPSFDAELLGNRMREHGITPSWNYHLIDIEALMFGVLRAYGNDIPIPWKSDVLSHMIGVPLTGEDERHTALGDARWAERVWDAVMGEVAHEVIDDDAAHEAVSGVAGEVATGDAVYENGEHAHEHAVYENGEHAHEHAVYENGEHAHEHAGDAADGG